MKKLAVCIVIFCSFVSCGEGGKDKMGFFDPANYYNEADSTRSVRDTQTYQRYIRQFLFVINEEGFINCDGYNYYIIYYHKRFTHIPVIKVIKSANGITIKCEKILHGKFKNFLTDTAAAARLFTADDYIDEKIQITSGDNIQKYKSILDSCSHLVHRFKSVCCDEDISFIYYFNGKDYYVFSNGFTDMLLMDKINSIFDEHTDYVIDTLK